MVRWTLEVEVHKWFSETNNANDDIRQLADAVTAGTQVYAAAIAQHHQQSANAVFMQSIAMKIDALPTRLQGRVCTEIMTIVSIVEIEAEEERAFQQL